MAERKEIVAPVGALDKLKKIADRIFDNPEILDDFPDFLYLSPKIPVDTVFSKEKFRLLRALKKNRGMGVSKLSKKLNRKPQAVSRDLKLLEKYNLVELKKKGREIEAEVRYSWVLFPVF